MFITLIRHAEPDWCPESEEVSLLDPDITGEGYERTRQVADRLASHGYGEIWQSTLRRSQSTAAVIGRRLTLRPETHSWLSELRYPKSWDRQPRATVQSSLAHLNSKPLPEMRQGHHSGETYPHFWIRVRQGLRNSIKPWAEREGGPWSPLWQAANATAPLLIVGHHGSLDLIARELLSIPGSQPYIVFDLDFLQTATFELRPMSTGHIWQLTNIRYLN